MLLLHETGVAFDPSWSLHPSTLIGTGVLAALYVWGIRARRRGHEAERPLPVWRVVCFVASCIVLLGSLNGPLHDLSDEYLFSAHMLQHLLLQLIWPILLLTGIPPWLLSPVFRPAWIRKPAVFLTRPVVAGLLFSLTIVAFHVPDLYDVMMQDHDMHILIHLVFMATAVIMWWPVLSPAPEVPRVSPGVQMLYLFLIGIPMQAVAAPISLADSVLYRFYEEAPRVWGLTPLEDQQIGGLLMWVPGGLFLAGVIAVIFFRWARTEV
ncbi:MAG: cytochrome c oxidase assembly protein [Gemmatimonadales bacterium]